MSFTICTIGCGRQATSNHGPAYAKYAATHPDTLLAACCDLDEEKAILFRDRFGFARHYSDIETMLRKEKPDAVCLVAPEPLTCELSCRVFEAGYPLLMEKPPGLNTVEIDRMIAAADRAGAASQVAFNRRYLPLLSVLKRTLEERFSPQDIQYLRYDFIRYGRMDADFAATAIHGIDTAKYLAGSDYQHIDCEYQNFPQCGPQVANIYLNCRMSSGTMMRLEFCPIAGVSVERATLYLHDHTFYLNLPMWNALDMPGQLLHLERGIVKENVSGLEVTGTLEGFEIMGFYAENASYFDDLRNGRRPVDDLRSARQSVAIAEAIRNRQPTFETTPEATAA
jgi:myo-inositol 2-dehydrogenase / D-chiro-inositol 1-dehydrogenase